MRAVSSLMQLFAGISEFYQFSPRRLEADTAADKETQYVTISSDGTVFLTRF